MKKILVVFGTRPEAIKMAPVVQEFQKSRRLFDTKVCVTAQHREMLDQVLSFFNIIPDYDLNLMKPGQNLHSLTADIIVNLKPILEDYKPDFVFVHGDTTTTMASSIASFYSEAKVCHVEAGLRTDNKYAPFPEEINRLVTSRITEYHFAPTKKAKENLVKENIQSENIIITGNTVIDALIESVEKVKFSNHPEIRQLANLIDIEKKLILVTGHRRENFGEGFLNICKALAEISDRDDVQIIYPVHLNPNVQKPVYEILGDKSNIKLTEPLTYESFIWLMNRSYLIITDSGGVQEEAPSLGKPVLVMRETTERPEAVEAGTVILVGTDSKRIVRETINLIDNQDLYDKMRHLHNPYGDGLASKKIVEFLSKKSLNV